MKKIYVILLTLICLMGFGLSFNKVEAANETKSHEWNLTSESGDWTSSGCELYFSQPYGIKKVNAYIINNNINDFTSIPESASNITLTIGVKSLCNGATTSKLTISLVDTNNGEIANYSKEVTPNNANNASKTTYKEVTFDAIPSTASGYKIQCTTFGKNVLINGTKYTLSYEYQANSYTVKYVNGQTNEVISTESLPLDGTGKATAPEVTPVSGYKFIGWYNGDVKYDFTQPVTSNLTITAKFELLPVTIASVLSEKDTTKTYRVAGVVTDITNGSTAYIQDGDSAIQIYKSGELDSQINVGKYVIVEGKYSVYNNNPQLSNVVFISESTTEYTKNTITNVSDVTESNLNRYVELSRLELSSIDTSGKSYTIKGQNFTLFYTNESYVQGEETTYITGNLVDIKGVIVKYNTKLEIFITSIALTPISVTSAFANVKTEAGLSFGYTESVTGNGTEITLDASTWTSATDNSKGSEDADKETSDSLKTAIFGENASYVSSISRALNSAGSFPGINSKSLVFYSAKTKGDTNQSQMDLEFTQSVSAIKVSYDGSNKITLINGTDSTVLENGQKVDVNSNSFTLKNCNPGDGINASNNRVTINSLTIYIGNKTVSYNKFDNIKIKFNYEFNPSTFVGEVTEQGFIVTDDSSFAFYSGLYSTTDPDFSLQAGLTTGKKLEKVVKNVTTDSFVLAIDVPIENGADSLYVCAYIVVNGTYYFATPINPTQNANNETVCGGYSVDSIIDKYVEAGMIPENIIPVVRELQEVIYA